MKNIDWELKNLDSLKKYIFDDLIGEHPNTSDINEAINRYAESYHEMKLKLLSSNNFNVSFIENIKNQIEYHKEQEHNRSKVRDYKQAIYHDNRRGALEDLLLWIKKH